MLQLLNLVKKSALPRLSGYDPVIREVDDPDQVVLPLEYPGQVHYFPAVGAGDTVRKGQPVAKSRNGNSVIASISGKVREIKSVWTAQSVHSPAIIIDGDGGQPMTAEEMFDGPVPAGSLEKAMMRMRTAGVAPPWTLSGREWREGEMADLPKIKAAIITGVRQETTVLTSQLLLDQQREKVATGLERVARLLPSSRICLTLPEAFRSWAESYFGSIVELHFLSESYIDRIEREVVARILGYRIPNRESYRDNGIAVLDLEYLLAIVDALDGKASLTHKCLTISGSDMAEAVTVRFPLGSSLRHILASQGLEISAYTRPVVGGPMKGVAQFTDKTPITYYNGIHLIAGETAPFDAMAPCINCGRCTRVCPVNIQVHLINRMVEFGQLDSAQSLNPEACHECGLCAFVCPAQRPIVQLLSFCNHDMIHGERFTWAAGGIS